MVAGADPEVLAEEMLLPVDHQQDWHQQIVIDAAVIK